MHHRSCADALHRVRKECAPSDAACARTLGVYARAEDAPCAVPTCCLLQGNSAPRYTCTPDGGAQCQRVHGLPLHGTPTRVARDA